MSQITHITKLEQLDSAFFDRRDVERIHFKGLEFDEVPAGLGDLDALAMVTFDNCTLKAFHPRAFEAGRKAGKVEVEFMYCEFDAEALFERALVHGLGTWRVQDYGFEYQRDPRWKQLQAIGEDGLGDEPFRRAAYGLAGAGTFREQTASELHLRFLDHSKKALRDKAAAFLDERLESPLGTGAVGPGAQVWVLGTPLHHDKPGLQARLEALGLKPVKALEGADGVLLMPKPGARLADALAAGLPILVEGHLEAAAQAVAGAAGEPVTSLPPPSAEEGESLERLLFNADPKNALLGLSLAKARALEGELLAQVVAVAFFSQDAAVRKEGKALLLASAPSPLRTRLQGDKRNYASLDDGKKLTKLVAELSGFGLDPGDFSLAMLRVFASRPRPYGGTFEGALEAALAQPGHEERAFELLADQPEIYLPVKKTFPKGLSRLRALTRLRIPHGTVKSDANIAELAMIPQPFDLEYWVKDTRFEHLRAIARNVKGLFLRGAYSNVSDISELARFENLAVLDLSNTGVTDLWPLAKLPLVSLNIKDTKVGSLEPLRSMRSLRGLFLSRLTCDLSPVAELVDLTHLDLSFTPIPDLALVSRLAALDNLDLWGTAVTDLGPLAGKPLRTLGLNYLQAKPDLTALLELPSLAWLSLTGTPVDGAQLQALQAKLPGLHVSR